MKKISFCLFFIIVSIVYFTKPVYGIEPIKLTLSECLDIAEDHHPSLISARESIKVAKAQLRESQASYLPQLSLSNSYSRSGSEDSDPKNSFGNSASVSQLIYDFGRTFSSIHQSEQNIKIQELNYLSTELDVLLNVKTAYYNTLQAKEQVQISQETLDNANLHLKLATNSYIVGKVAKVDVSKAEVEVANAELNLVSAKNSYEVNVRTLNNAMGLEANTYENVELEETPYSIVFTELNTLISKAIKNRPDVQSYIYQREQLKASLKSAQMGHFPSISAGGSYSQSGSDFPLSYSWSGSISLSMSIFNGFKTEAQITEARANLRSLDASETKTYQDVQLDVTTNYLNTKSGEEKIKAAQKLVDQSKESLRLATGRYENGLGSILDLTDAQVSYTNAKVSYTQAVYDYLSNYAKLQKSLGEK